MASYGREPPKPFQFRKQFDESLPGFRIVVDEPLVLPPKWPLIVGDFCNSARSTLDYIAWVVVQQGSSAATSDPQKVGFPIWGTKQQFLSAAGVALPGVRKTHMAVIRRHQPYHDGPVEAASHPLAILKSLNNTDKHRNLHVVSTYARDHFSLEVLESTDFVFRSAERGANLDECLFGGSGFYVGAELGTISGTVTGPNPDVIVRCAGTNIVILESGYILPDLLDWIGSGVLSVIKDIEPLL